MRSICYPTIFLKRLNKNGSNVKNNNRFLERTDKNGNKTEQPKSKPHSLHFGHIGALRRLSRNGDPVVLISAMNRLRDFSRRLGCDSFDAVRRQLEGANAFSDDDGKILRF